MLLEVGKFPKYGKFEGFIGTKFWSVGISQNWDFFVSSIKAGTVAWKLNQMDRSSAFLKGFDPFMMNLIWKLSKSKYILGKMRVIYPMDNWFSIANEGVIPEKKYTFTLNLEMFLFQDLMTKYVFVNKTGIKS